MALHNHTTATTVKFCQILPASMWLPCRSFYHSTKTALLELLTTATTQVMMTRNRFRRHWPGHVGCVWYDQSQRPAPVHLLQTELDCLPLHSGAAPHTGMATVAMAIALLGVHTIAYNTIQYKYLRRQVNSLSTAARQRRRLLLTGHSTFALNMYN